MHDDGSQNTPLREHLAKIEAAQAREHMAPILKEMESAAWTINRSARTVEEAVFSFRHHKRELC